MKRNNNAVCRISRKLREYRNGIPHVKMEKII